MSKKEIKGTRSRKAATKNIVQGDIVLNPEFPDVITVRQVEVLGGYRVRMRFSNNETRELNLKPYLRGPVFEAIRRELTLFQQVYVDPDTETLTWPNGVDMDPQTLYEDGVQVQVNQPRKTAVPSPNPKSVRSRSMNKNRTIPKAQRRLVVRLQAKQK